MPENKSENANILDGEAVPEAAGAEAAQAENAWVAFERGRLSRRQALKKLGMTSAMATFALFSVDDLARMVGKAMQQRAGDNKVAGQIAREFQQAGIVLADPGGDLTKACGGDSTPPAGRSACCTPEAVGKYCNGYNNYAQCDHCCDSVYGTDGYCNGYNQADSKQDHFSRNFCQEVAKPDA